MKNLAYLLLGGNQGNIRRIFSQAIDMLYISVGPVQDISPLYKTEPWGFQSEDAFLNQVITIQTDLSPDMLLKEVLIIEEKLGRSRQDNSNGYKSRTIDIDILFYNDEIIKRRDLIIPHPKLHLRKFTLAPLNDIAPGLNHPVLNKTISELIRTCDDKHSAIRISDIPL
ncbi:MAG: 2-amino-4-hydroxy-6-hydroxymethyldihydropteridine diphosphokinase [Bacteroidales bacterium]